MKDVVWDYDAENPFVYNETYFYVELLNVSNDVVIEYEDYYGYDAGDYTAKGTISYDKDNYEIINEDILNIDLKSEIKRYNRYNKIYFISNLPYYITTPIITKILNEAPFVTRYVMMMQKEVGLRLTGEPKSKDYGAITIMLKYKGDARIMFDVDRKSFTPAPNVDSCVVRFDLYDYKKYNPLDEELLFKLIRASFIQRRKTLVNNLSTVYNKDFINKMLTDNSFNLNVRAEELSIEDFIKLADYIFKEKK